MSSSVGKVIMVKQRETVTERGSVGMHTFQKNLPEKEAMFHGFYTDSKADDSGPPIPGVVAVVEYEDGSVGRVAPEDIRFVRPALAKWRK